MRKTSNRREAAPSDQLHPWIYRAMVGLAVVLILSVWGFAGTGLSNLALVVVSGIIFVAVAVAVAIPTILWRIWRNHAFTADQGESFAAWQERDFEICEGHLKGADAALQVLVPIAAGPLGMAVFALVLHFDIGSSPLLTGQRRPRA